ncbi:FAD-binding dehydrogenase [Saccharopolyspora sp. HNM0983]|uniref:FAD-binding dehydrogenase n=1 Tax=Saccharopolyspora montiporae TaxID=2781240 RepID=A0A929BAE8_9PSEU|nr:FAD-binding dehydrogenase [Saccharopolyspora sp. HNM0983]MBE9373977.1 FAD-binding dehydrogenase [Saccharopolyspora sp. HNM0983]
MPEADVIVVGAGLAGLVATAELADAGKRVLVLDQEPEASLGGQAHWSFGGLFFVDSPEQRRLGVHDSPELALQDWFGSAAFDRPEDRWPREWARAYVEFAAGEKRAWLAEQGVRFFPLVQWAERGGHLATGHGNSVPRFHITWGTGPGLLEPFLRRVRSAERRGLVRFRFRHRVSELITEGGSVTGVRGELLAPSGAQRGEPSTREQAGEFELRAQAVLVSSGGIGGDVDLVRQNWPQRCGPPPQRMIAGVPDHVDGRMLGIAAHVGASVINPDRMWHYTEGIRNYAPVWTEHGIRILPGPSSLWVDARGQRLPSPLFPGFDTLGTMEHITRTGYDHTWFVLNRRIIGREFALSGSEQNPDLTGRSVRGVLQRGGGGTPGPIAEFVRSGPDFVVRRTLGELVRGMNDLVGEQLVDESALHEQVRARDRQLTSGFGKDEQVNAIRDARRYAVDRLVRVAPPHELLDPEAGPLIAVRLSLLTRKTLGGLETDLSGQVVDGSGEVLPGLYAAGEAAGFGGGGVHGYRALEGTFLGGCLFSGRQAGRALAAAVA